MSSIKPKTSYITSSTAYTPPMGPLIHPEYIENAEYAYDAFKKKNILLINHNAIFKYVYMQRFPQLLQSTNVVLSKMEIEDLLVLSDIARKYLKDRMYINEFVNKSAIQTRNAIKNLYVQSPKINDSPLRKKIGVHEVSPYRYEIRITITKIFSRIRDLMHEMKLSIKNKEFAFLITEQQIKNILLDKNYLDEIIRLKIFTYSDLYSNVFATDKVFSHIVTIYNEYYLLYSKLIINNQNTSTVKTRQRPESIYKPVYINLARPLTRYVLPRPVLVPKTKVVQKTRLVPVVANRYIPISMPQYNKNQINKYADNLAYEKLTRMIDENAAARKQIDEAKNLEAAKKIHEELNKKQSTQSLRLKKFESLIQKRNANIAASKSASAHQPPRARSL